MRSNCSGNLVTRPIHPPQHMANNPASTQRVQKQPGCPAS
ncbi:DUF1272 domain-containing protein [Aestuariirhabdus litorea]|uniref:DUF1272 domain-containing protein n=1 Tax=Aestuariirhabdus litorea TaxID=2528527 RepID=A0A3P3VRS1_9GAMM|nr:DUF1272 domain-containing protein [Aestuariirhabdus litorea]RWW93668.1 DUF1272 domain-containing protein [Endozoicomonadaceae bacterium GTF-13]